MNPDFTFRNIKTAESGFVTNNRNNRGVLVQYIPRLAATPVEPEPTA